ncbi:MAG: hypothetical protein OEV94_04290 [Deltaproteobacteria bacterium]|nr:hypothetical protein [Deltaproteobacteria bacterium]
MPLHPAHTMNRAAPKPRWMRRPDYRPAAALALALGLLMVGLAGMYAWARHQRVFLGEAVLLTPPGYRMDREYPLLVILPATFGTSESYLESHLLSDHNPFHSLQKRWENTLRERYPNPADLDAHGFFVLLPPGEGTTDDHSAEGFAQAIARYERRVKEGLGKALMRYPISRQRVGLAGHSLGGDLSWALSLRHPDQFNGAVISGSRTSYWEPKRLSRMRARGFRFQFFMGEFEDPIRLAGLQGSLGRLEAAGVAHRYDRVAGVGHRAPKDETLFQALEFALRTDQPIAQHKPVKPRRQAQTKGIPFPAAVIPAR